jgi:outer membrane protein with beta-barrel domain
MSIWRLLVVCALCVGILAFAVPARAQGLEVSAGYNYLHIDTDDEEEDLANLPLGWYADVAANVTSMFGVVGQITGNYKTIDVGGGFDVDTKIHTFMGGVRAGGGTSNVRPFGQVLFGVANAKFSGAGFDDSSTDGALQLGAGVNVMSGAVGVRLGGDYIRVFSEDEGTNVFRLAVGIVFGS